LINSFSLLGETQRRQQTHKKRQHKYRSYSNKCQLPTIANVEISTPDRHTLIIEKPRDLPLNDLFDALASAGIKVRSMRNQTNRLEELFVRLTAKEQAA